MFTSLSPTLDPEGEEVPRHYPLLEQWGSRTETSGGSGDALSYTPESVPVLDSPFPTDTPSVSGEGRGAGGELRGPSGVSVNPELRPGCVLPTVPDLPKHKGRSDPTPTPLFDATLTGRTETTTCPSNPLPRNPPPRKGKGAAVRGPICRPLTRRAVTV